MSVYAYMPRKMPCWKRAKRELAKIQSSTATRTFLTPNEIPADPRCPCLRCSVKIVQCGVREVVYNQSYSMDEASARILKEGGVILRQLHLPTDVQSALL